MNFVLQPWQLLLAILAGWINRQQQEVIEYLRTENQNPQRKTRQSPDRRGRRGQAPGRCGALSGAPRGHLALLLPTRSLTPCLHPGTAEPPGDRSTPKGRGTACRGRIMP